jgi:predicted secreted protein with PEFG-CTERM motif
LKIIPALLFVVLVFVMSLPQVHALQEVAGKINVDIKPGETKSFLWGLVSDSNQTTTLNLSASGSGSEFLIYPQNVTLAPKELQNIEVNVTIPSTYSTAQTLTPFITATEPGQKGGPTTINLSVLKIVTINIEPTPVPEFGSLSTLVLAVAIITTLAIFTKSGHLTRL